MSLLCNLTIKDGIILLAKEKDGLILDWQDGDCSGKQHRQLGTVTAIKYDESGKPCFGFIFIDISISTQY